MPEAPQPGFLPLRVIELPDVLDLKAATPLTVEFLSMRGRPLDVDASRVERLGGQCLQVLLSAAKT
jgi:chemotaxis protein CheX